jgi:hypothetical protein
LTRTGHLGDDLNRRELVGCLFLLDDLLQRESYLAGELEEVTPTVLSQKQVRNESPLPEYLLPTVSQQSDAVLTVGPWKPSVSS